DSAQDVPTAPTIPPAILNASQFGVGTSTEVDSLAPESLSPIRVGTILRVPLVLPITANDSVTGYLTTWAPITPIQQRIERLSSTLFPDTDAAVTLIDDKQRFLIHTDPARILHTTGPHFFGPLTSANPTEFRENYAITSDYEDDRGDLMTGSAVKIASVPWAVVVRIRGDVAYASLNRMRVVVASTVTSITVISLLLGVWLAHRWLRPVKHLVYMASQLSQRIFSSRVEVSQSDELGVLSHAMNQAAANLEAGEHKLRTELAIRTDLGRYLPAPIVEKIVRREQDMALGGKRQMITVLFADVVAFTPLTEALDPEVVVSLLNELFTVLSEVIFRHNGTVDKFIGDCVMALFGAPEPSMNHAKSAVSAAEDMLAFVESANNRWEDQYGTQIQIAIGIHSGEAVIGNIGSSQRMEYTAIGDVVNIAARLETLAQPRQILVTDYVRILAGTAFEYNDLGLRSLVGKETPVHVFEVRA
ncbi:MAG: HAMP domain-containing protein, partial [Myxococcales bacterium]|nr:HAMP domain-containing protein [Myxococcales bacterium]